MNPGDPARRGRQAGVYYRGDPTAALLEVLDPARTSTFRRSLPRGRTGPVRRPVHRYGERGRRDPGSAARPDGTDRAGRLYRGRKGHDRSRSPAAAPARSRGAGGHGGHLHRRRAAGLRPSTPARGRSVAGADHRQGLRKIAAQARVRHRDDAAHRGRWRPRRPTSAIPGNTPGVGRAEQRSRVWLRLADAALAETCCSSRPRWRTRTLAMRDPDRAAGAM